MKILKKEGNKIILKTQMDEFAFSKLCIIENESVLELKMGERYSVEEYIDAIYELVNDEKVCAELKVFERQLICKIPDYGKWHYDGKTKSRKTIFQEIVAGVRYNELVNNEKYQQIKGFRLSESGKFYITVKVISKEISRKSFFDILKATHQKCSLFGITGNIEELEFVFDNIKINIILNILDNKFLKQADKLLSKILREEANYTQKECEEISDSFITYQGFYKKNKKEVAANRNMLSIKDEKIEILSFRNKTIVLHVNESCESIEEAAKNIIYVVQSPYFHQEIAETFNKDIYPKYALCGYNGKMILIKCLEATEESIIELFNSETVNLVECKK